MGLTVGARFQGTVARTRPNPRITDVTHENLVAQCQFRVQIRATANDPNLAEIAIQDATAQLDRRLAASEGDTWEGELGAVNAELRSLGLRRIPPGRDVGMGVAS